MYADVLRLIHADVLRLMYADVLRLIHADARSTLLTLHVLKTCLRGRPENLKAPQV